VREIRMLRATWRGLETWHGRDASANRRASPRPYREGPFFIPSPTIRFPERAQWGHHSPNAKGNFCFDRVIALDRSRYVLDLRLKR
jgi:hypothetical protein